MIDHPVLWPAIGALALSIGIGVQLGESAVGEIDPVYFQGAALHPRDRGAAIDPNAQPPLQSAYAQAYGWAEGNAARLAESGVDYPYAPTPVAYQGIEPGWQPRAMPAVDLQAWAPGEVSARPRVERYMDYPIEADPADRAEANDEAATDEADRRSDKEEEEFEVTRSRRSRP
jgi:hypothetical protein